MVSLSAWCNRRRGAKVRQSPLIYHSLCGLSRLMALQLKATRRTTSPSLGRAITTHIVNYQYSRIAIFRYAVVTWF
jgi:hypothetical protein